MIADYCNQTIVWKRVVSRNAANEPTTVSTSIKGRKQTASQMVRHPNGQEVTATQAVYTLVCVAVGDFLDDRMIVAVETMTSLSGIVEGYKALLT